MDSNLPAPTEINVITLNCWGLKYLAKFRNERLAEIGKRIACANPVPQIVGLQECWTHQDYQSIRRQTKHILPYGKFYHSGIFGGGLAILSKWPIEEASMFRYPLNGRPTAFFRGDWFVGKGVASARIRYGPGPKDIAEVFTTHLHAPYESEPNDSYICHRTAQAWEISKLLRGAAERGHLVLALGDFNMIPLSLAHRLICTHSPVRDVWHLLHPDSSLGSAEDPVEKARRRPIPTAEHNIVENGATCDSVLNTWRWNKAQQKRLGPNQPPIEVPRDSIDPKAKRLDYIFASTGYSIAEGGWIVKSARVGMLDRHPELQCSLSDHFSIEATLLHSKAIEAAASKEENDSALRNGTFLQTTSSSERRARHEQFKYSPPPHLPLHVYDEILAMVEKYRRRENRQRRLRLGHFLGSLLISIGCLIAVWWSPRNFVAFLLMLFSTLCLSAGVIDGLIGGLFVGSELRALKEFEWEISNAKAAAGGETLYLAHEGVKDW
ncbi:DNase I-like protein [Venustampulla echinocandica]|uniref:DNase I-like protein n=1 Tax=Venustampulla echinocandica TaxID=2656787 RepID=A0A370THV4_9HELO|nr:DNase I-like protein [Venustampulla echinocandica]RDL34777.1 DNase I-like protein [Venustampulla echinocandica]